MPGRLPVAAVNEFLYKAEIMPVKGNRWYWIYSIYFSNFSNLSKKLHICYSKDFEIKKLLRVRSNAMRQEKYEKYVQFQLRKPIFALKVNLNNRF
jgi:hypothetical protein